MIKQNFIIDELENKRILNLHESRTKNLYLIKEQAGDATKKESYPPCVQGFGNPVDFGGGVYGIIGTGDWVGYSFNTMYYYDPNTKKNNNKYYCKGNEIIFGDRQGVTTGSKPGVTNADTDWKVIENGEKLIKIGSSGPLVKKLQGWLQDLNSGDEKIGGVGCSVQDSSKCDGKFGPGTKNAVIKYQKENGLNKDGIVGQQFYQTMNAAKGVPVKKPGVRQSTTNTNEQIKRIASAFCSTAVGSNGMNIAAYNSKWNNKPFADYAKEVNASDEEIIAAAKTCPYSSRTKIIAKFLKDPSKLSKQVEYSTHVEK